MAFAKEFRIKFWFCFVSCAKRKCPGFTKFFRNREFTTSTWHGYKPLYLCKGKDVKKAKWTVSVKMTQQQVEEKHWKNPPHSINSCALRHYALQGLPGVVLYRHRYSCRAALRKAVRAVFHRMGIRMSVRFKEILTAEFSGACRRDSAVSKRN